MLLATTRGRQQGDPKASGLRPRGVIGLSYFAAEAQPRGFLNFWETSAWLSYWPLSLWMSCTVNVLVLFVAMSDISLRGVRPGGSSSVHEHHILTPQLLPHRAKLRASSCLQRHARVMEGFISYPNDHERLFDAW